MPIETIRNVVDFDAMEGDWDSLVHVCGDSPLQNHAWYSSALHAWPEHRPHVVVRRQDGQLTGALPLVEPAREYGHGLRVIGWSPMQEPTDPLAASPADLCALIQHLRHWRRLVLERVSPEQAAALKRCWGPLAFGRQSGGAPRLAITGDWGDYLGAMSSKFRYDLRRAARRAGRYRCEILIPTPATLEGPFGLAVDLEDAGWKGRQGSSLKQHRALRRFFFRFAGAMAQREQLRIALLYVDDIPCAMQLAVVHRGAYWMLKIGYDERYAQCSPGLLLMQEVIRQAHEEGLQAVEFLGAAAPWVQRWANDTRHAAIVYAYPYQPLSVGYLLHDLSRLAQRRGRTLWNTPVLSGLVNRLGRKT